MKTKYTPAPWYVDDQIPPNAMTVIARTTFENIPISANTSDAHNDRSNAKLIASAPDLLEALIKLSDAVRINHDTPLSVDGFDKAIKAIQKATK